jgi:hypothetical protein
MEMSFMVLLACAPSTIYLVEMSSMVPFQFVKLFVPLLALPFIIYSTLTSVFSCSLFTLEPKAPLSLALFFLLGALLGNYIKTFFLLSIVVYISSLILFTLVNGFYGISF